jgi:hypothetical protein
MKTSRISLAVAITLTVGLFVGSAFATDTNLIQQASSTFKAKPISRSKEAAILFPLITNGMTREAIESLLGTPDHNDGDIWGYTIFYSQALRVDFKDDRVISKLGIGIPGITNNSDGQGASVNSPVGLSDKVDKKWQWQINIDGTIYDIYQAQTGLLNVFDSTNTDLKLDWLYRLQYEGKNFQSNTIAKMVQLFHGETNSEVRRAIIDLVRYSRDRQKILELCALAENDPDPTISKIANGYLHPQPSVRHYDPNAKEIQVDGVKYDLPKAQVELFSALDSTNGELKRKWLRAVGRFGTDLQPTIVPRLISAFQMESDVKAKIEVLYAIQASRDPKLIEVCRSVQNDADASIRLLAGAILIGQKQFQGVEMITRCLPELDDKGQRNGMRSVWQAIGIFSFDYKPVTVIKSPEPTHDELETVIAEWTKWWNENKQRYNPAK